MTSEKLILNNGILSGVCAGIAQRLNTSPWLIRLLFLVGAIFFIVPIPVYLLLWLIMPKENYVIDGKPRSLLYSAHLPRWFVIYSYVSLFGVLFWPIVFFASIFMFDNPSDFLLTLIIFLLLNAYPVLFVALIVHGFKTYKKHSNTAVLFPLLPLISTLAIIIYFFL